MNHNTLKSWSGALMGAAALLVSGTAGAAEMRRPAPTVRVEKVATLDRGESRNYVATSSPYALVEVVARVSGTMNKAPFKEGGLVKKGELLYKIEDTVYAANVRSAKATVAQVEAELAFARSEYERYKTLIASKATSRTNYESAVRALKSCEARLEAAKAALTLAENDLSYTKIYSPIDGRIGRSVYSSNNYITPSKGTLATIVQYDPIKLKFAMSEADYLRHFGGDSKNRPELEIVRADGVRIDRKAKLDFVDNMVDSGTGTLMLQFLVPNPDQALIPAGFVTVKCYEKFPEPRPAVNIAALMTDGKNYYVYVVNKENKIERRNVTVGEQVGDRQVILSGLKAGEMVVTGGIHKTVPGGSVNPVGFAEVEKK